jgi:hypothetical protein
MTTSHFKTEVESTRLKSHKAKYVKDSRSSDNGNAQQICYVLSQNFREY